MPVFGEGMAKKISEGITSAMEDKVIGMMFGGNQPANRGGGQQNSAPRGPVQCHECKQYGHIARHCPLRYGAQFAQCGGMGAQGGYGGYHSQCWPAMGSMGPQMQPPAGWQPMGGSYGGPMPPNAPSAQVAPQAPQGWQPAPNGAMPPPSTPWGQQQPGPAAPGSVVMPQQTPGNIGPPNATVGPMTPMLPPPPPPLPPGAPPPGSTAMVGPLGAEQQPTGPTTL